MKAIIAIVLFLGAVNAGVLTTSHVVAAPTVYHHAPIVHHAPVVTAYASSSSYKYRAPAAKILAAPIVHHAPIATVHHAPIVHTAPVVMSHGVLLH